LITKKQSDQIEAIQKRTTRIIYPCAHDMPYTSAIFLADLPTMSDRSDQLARKLFKSTIQPTSSLHNLLSPPREHPSITRLRVPSSQNFLASPPEPKNANHSSHMFSPTTRLHNCFFHCIYCFCLFVCTVFLFAFYDFVQPLAITFNKRCRMYVCTTDRRICHAISQT